MSRRAEETVIDHKDRFLLVGFAGEMITALETWDKAIEPLSDLALPMDD